jgi:hypothetical protein
MFTLLCILLRAAWAQAPDVPHGGGACATDWDCSLGGTCSEQLCVCDLWWTGESCAQLNLQPADPQACGLVAPGYLSWGGHPLRDAATGTYHLLASFMCNHATLDAWKTKSSIAHATSRDPAGPYLIPEGLDKQLVLPPWSHGAYVVQDPPTGEYLLWHLGNASVDRSTWFPCYNSSDAEEAAAGGAAEAPAAGLEPGGREAFVESAPSLEGPWTAFNNNTGVLVSFPADSWTQMVDNPAPYIFPNGTTLLYFKGRPCPPSWGALAPMCIGVARADSWRGPYTALFSQPITHPEGEDPCVFRDPRGRFHMLTNVNTWHARCPAGVPCGGHAWSYDGLTFSNQSIGAFGPVVRWQNGSYFVGAYAERPQVLQDTDGTPLVFFTGFGMSSYFDSHNFAQRFCTPGAPAGTCGPTQLPKNHAV